MGALRDHLQLLDQLVQVRLALLLLARHLLCVRLRVLLGGLPLLVQLGLDVLPQLADGFFVLGRGALEAGQRVELLGLGLFCLEGLAHSVGN